MSTRANSSREALYYPFHLCSKETLERLLGEYSCLHFRDYMALQLTALTGTTAFADRMGDFYPDLLTQGRIIQGYSVSGPLDASKVLAVNRDLADRSWRVIFHEALREDRRFQRGLLNLSHGMHVGGTIAAGPAAFLRLTEECRIDEPFSVQRVQSLGTERNNVDAGYSYEYGVALLKTSAALTYTVGLCLGHGLEAVSDSATHHDLLERTCLRDRISIANPLLKPSIEAG